LTFNNVWLDYNFAMMLNDRLMELQLTFSSYNRLNFDYLLLDLV
jgi:hypothetical protein